MQATKTHNRITKKQRFTLVELMVVLIIAGILIAALAPAFNRLMTGNAVGAAARMVSSQLSLARSEAVSRRQYIAVIMPGETFAQEDTTDKNLYLYRYQSFRSAIVEPTGTDNEFTFKQWVQGTTWTFLPVGAVIAEANNDVIELTTTEPRLPAGDAVWTSVDGNAYHKIADGISPAKIFDVPLVNNSNVRAVVFKPNGRCNSRIYVTIMEGMVATPDGAIERANKSNIRVMEINAFTGQIRYLF
jgi:prepilin-type N-terminal cleavage/methylation domain-containing protein